MFALLIQTFKQAANILFASLFGCNLNNSTMRVMKTKLFFLLLILGILGSCEPTESFSPNEIGIVEGVRPIYSSSEDWNIISSKGPQPIQSLGKIYYKDQHIYVNERFKGIHIIDNSNPSNPVPIKFIEVLGSEDIAIKGNFLYVDNITDLVVLDISNLQNIQEINRVANLYPDAGQATFPLGYTGFFECVDDTQGIVVGWETTILDNPTCWR